MSTMKDSISNLGARQQDLLRELRRERDGLTVDELVERLGVTRTAVNQHLRALEEKDYVARGTLRGTGGRPSSSYLITSKGSELFPRQYSWFSSLLISRIRKESGTESLSSILREMATSVASQLTERLRGKPLRDRIHELVTIMEELGYEAREPEKASAFPIIEAQNCIYHALATEHPEVCDFDIRLLEELSGADVEHEECMVKGGRVCRFRFKER